jgi:hypothetical protein
MTCSKETLKTWTTIWGLQYTAADTHYFLFYVANDFTTNDIMVTINPGTSLTPVQFQITDDLILEETEEGFLAVILLDSAMFEDLIEFDADRLTLIRIRDNDSEIHIERICQMSSMGYFFPNINETTSPIAMRKCMTGVGVSLKV